MPERTSAYRKLLIGAASAIVVLVVVVLVAPLLIPSDVIAAQIAALVRQKTGRDLRIAGPISFSLLPRPTLVAHDVTMSNPPGDFTANFLEVQTVDMSLRSRALLHGAIEIDQLHLSHPILNLEIDKDGRRNWIFHLPKAEPSTAPAAPRRAPPSFATGNAQLADGEVNYSHDHAGEKQSVSNVTMTLSLPGLDRPLTANGTATYRGEPVRLSLSLASPGELRDGRASAATMALSSARGSFDFRGSINRGANPSVNGTISANVLSLRELLSWTNIKIGPDDKGLGAFALNGHIEHTGPQTLLSNATVSLDDVPAKGTFRLTHAEKR
ncbi:MAG TPA: AsmA family protein, partial [Stellaceae bacterium]|nr:AsmA family protein [Stellaceae bacterium]